MHEQLYTVDDVSVARKVVLHAEVDEVVLSQVAAVLAIGRQE